MIVVIVSDYHITSYTDWFKNCLIELLDRAGQGPDNHNEATQSEGETYFNE
jgi:hypothetical protein